jgi:hypothetical protein
MSQVATPSAAEATRTQASPPGMLPLVSQASRKPIRRLDMRRRITSLIRPTPRRKAGEHKISRLAMSFPRSVHGKCERLIRGETAPCPTNHSICTAVIGSGAILIP